MARKSLSLFDLIDLPEEQRDVVLYLIDNSPQSAENLAQHFSCSVPEIEATLQALLDGAYITQLADNLYEAFLGQRSTRTETETKKHSSFMDSLLDKLVDGE